VPALTARQIDVPLDFDSIGAIGTFFGAASLIVVDDRCCMVQLALRSTKFYMHESCGKCTPCREGTRWLVQILEKLERGDGAPDDLDLLRKVCDRIEGKSLCALGDFAVWPVRATSTSGTTSSSRTSSRAVARSAESRHSRASSRPPTSTPIHPLPRCPRERARAGHRHDRRPRGPGAQGPRAR
jgi:hypothetical protein